LTGEDKEIPRPPLEEVGDHLFVIRVKGTEQEVISF